MAWKMSVGMSPDDWLKLMLMWAWWTMRMTAMSVTVATALWHLWSVGIPWASHWILTAHLVSDDDEGLMMTCSHDHHRKAMLQTDAGLVQRRKTSTKAQMMSEICV
jgi:hypothetical protein